MSITTFLYINLMNLQLFRIMNKKKVRGKILRLEKFQTVTAGNKGTT